MSLVSTSEPLAVEQRPLTFLNMQVLAWMLVTLVLAVDGQNDAANSTDSGVGSSNNAGTIATTSVVVSLVLIIVVALTITMWVCACCRPEKTFKRKSTRQTSKWHWKSNMRRAAASQSDMDRLPIVGVMEADDKRKSLDLSRINSMELGDSKVWRSNENMTMDGSCDDLYASQNYVNTMNYSENENDFQTLKLDEALFENPSSRSRSEAQLPNLVFSNTPGLQVKAKKLEDLSSDKVLEFYDLQTPKNSPRRKNKVSCSTGDLVSESSPSLNVRPTTTQTESPLMNQQQQEILVTIEQTDSTVDNADHTIGRVDNEQVSTNSENQLQPVDTCTTDQTESVTLETSSLQEDNVSCVSKDNLREISTGTPDSGVVVNEDKSEDDQSGKSDNTSELEGSVVTDFKSDTSSVHSSTHVQHTAVLNVGSTDTVANEEPAVTILPIVNNTGTWETVADRKKRYLQTVEHSIVQRKSSTEDYQPTNMASNSLTQVEADSDYGNSDEEHESTAMLSSSQPLLNLTSLKEQKTLIREDSSSDSDTEEMQSPLISTKLSPRDNTTVVSYTNPLLSDDDSSDEDCEMVQPSEVVVYRPPVKSDSQDVHHRASHPPLQRTLNHEQVITSTVQHTKRLRHKPSLKSIREEDCNNTQHMHTF